MWELLRIFEGWLAPALLIACGLLALTRLRIRRAAVFASGGFACLALRQLMVSHSEQMAYYPTTFWAYVLLLLLLGGLGLILFAFTQLPTRLQLATGEAPVQRDRARDVGASAPPPLWPRPSPSQFAAARRELGPHQGTGLATGWIVVSAVVVLFALVLGIMIAGAGRSVSSRELRQMMPVIVILVGLSIASTILFCMWLYRAWRVVPPAFRSITPGQAVGFLFIPLFNMYWFFRAVPGLSKAIARAHDDVEPAAPRGTSHGLGLTAAIVSLIPYLNVLTWVFLLLWFILVNAEKHRLAEALWAAESIEEATVPG